MQKEEYDARVMRRLVLFSLFTVLGAFIHFYNMRTWHKPSSIETSIERKFDAKSLSKPDEVSECGISYVGDQQ